MTKSERVVVPGSTRDRAIVFAVELELAELIADTCELWEPCHERDRRVDDWARLAAIASVVRR